MQRPLWLERLIIFLPVLFAHGPLCRSFKKDLFCIRGIYFCRSCSFLLLGFALSIPSIIFLNLTQFTLYTYLSIFLSILVLTFSYPRLYKTLSRPIKDCLRFSLGWSLANLLLLLIFKKLFLFLIITAFLWILKVVYSGIRSKMKDQACDHCEEFHQDKLCSGFLPKAKLMKKYEEQINRMLADSKS